MTIDANSTVKDVAAMDGVKDLPVAVKAKFISALLAEAKGDYGLAETKLNEAVEAETKHFAALASPTKAA